MELEIIEEIIRKKKKIYLYGAGVVAYGVYKALNTLYKYKIDGYLVTTLTENEKKIEDIPVMEFADFKEQQESVFIFIAAPEEYHEDIEKSLLKKGYLDFAKVDAQMEYALMSTYHSKVHHYKIVKDFHGINETVLEKNEDEKEKTDESVFIGMAVSVYDKPLKNTYEEQPWVHKIQVGAIHTKEQIANRTDEGKESLSHKNDLYGELTATYRLWKDCKSSVIGIYHYRRVLELESRDLKILTEGTADVILPLPFVCQPDTSGQYSRYLCEEDVKIMKQVLQRRDPLHWSWIEEALKGECLYNYNILVARKEVFEDYCNWMFPMLEEMEQICERNPRERLSRYIGRVGEVLTAVYFLANWKNWKIVHGKKVWRV